IVSSMVPANPYNPPLRRGLMKVRFISVVAGIVAIAAPLAAQNQSGSARRPQAAKADAKPYVAPKTPWGHPDISGVWTSDSVRGIPMERPAALAGKAELSEEEFADKVKRDTATRTTAENAEGA